MIEKHHRASFTTLCRRPDAVMIFRLCFRPFHSTQTGNTVLLRLVRQQSAASQATPMYTPSRNRHNRPIYSFSAEQNLINRPHSCCILGYSLQAVDPSSIYSYFERETDKIIGVALCISKRNVVLLQNLSSRILPNILVAWVARRSTVCMSVCSHDNF